MSILKQYSGKDSIDKLVYVAGQNWNSINIGRQPAKFIKMAFLEIAGGLEKSMEMKEDMYEVLRSTSQLRIAVVTVGSRGDVQPYLALCKVRLSLYA